MSPKTSLEFALMSRTHRLGLKLNRRVMSANDKRSRDKLHPRGVITFDNFDDGYFLFDFFFVLLFLFLIGGRKNVN